jgi:hypothetical protein
MILFTDDDVRPPEDWIDGMCEPILLGKAQAVAGGVRIAPKLHRPWMEALHRGWLASTEGIDPAAPYTMFGANMGFSREVLSKVPAFDTELGPGALGFGDEMLFSWQLLEAGYQIHGALDVAVEHHFEPFDCFAPAFSAYANADALRLTSIIIGVAAVRSVVRQRCQLGSPGLLANQTPPGLPPPGRLCALKWN